MKGACMVQRFGCAVVIIGRVGIGLLFLLSALSKLRDPGRFEEAVDSYKMLSLEAVAVIASGLPWLELFLSLCLLCGIFVSGSFLLSIVLFTVFAGAQVSAISRGLSIGCGCFGLSSGPGSDVEVVGLQSLFRTSIFGVFAIVGYSTFIWTRLSRVNETSRSQSNEH